MPTSTENHSVNLYREFCQFLSEIRRFFNSQGFVETPTPTLVPCPGMEAHLDPIATSTGLYLPTSPEIHLKRLLCRGFERIFELRPCFRNDPETPHHLMEFQMLEWYRVGATHLDLMEDIEALLEHLSQMGMWPHATRPTRLTFQDLFLRTFSFYFRPETTAEQLKGLFKDHEIHYSEDDTKEDLIHRLMIEKFEPEFRGLVLLADFPPEMAILSQIGKNGFAERFELYFNQMELANAFHEVTDPKTQRERWQKDEKEREVLGVRRLKPDQNLLRDMETLGLPQSAGIALGVDRLFMAAKNLKHISQIRPF